MKIEDVLKGTGKAIPTYQEKNRFSNVYASLDDGGVLWWHSMESDERLEPVPLNVINEKTWGDYHEEKAIKPERAGELWRGDITGTYYHTEIFEQRLVWASDGMRLEIKGDDYHKNSMTRLYPPVEDDSVNRIEILPEMIRANQLPGNLSTYQFELPEGYYDKVCGQPLILEIPKI